MSSAENLADFLMKSAREYPEMAALSFEGRKLTFKMLDRRVNKLARAMTGAGITRGQHIGVFSTNGIECVEVMFAAAKLGCILVPFNYRLKAEEARSLFDHSEISALFFCERYWDLIQNLTPKLSAIRMFVCFERGGNAFLDYEDLISNESDEELFPVPCGEDVALILYTSGTTGFPKGVMLSHRHLVTRIKTRDMDLLKIARGGRSLMIVPHYHTAGIQGILKNIHRPMTLVMVEQFETELFLETAMHERIEACTLVPTMLKKIADYPGKDRYDLSCLKQIKYGTAPMSPELLKRAMEVFPNCSFTQGYGMTEGSATTLSVEDHTMKGPPDAVENKVKRLRSVGKAIKDVEIRITDADGNNLPPRVAGKILIRGPAILSGYWKAPETTQDAVKDGWLDTGDTGYLDEDEYLFLTGREKDIIIRGGENISPIEIENILESHSQVSEAAVIGVPDPEWGEVVVAIVITNPGKTVNGKEIMAYCDARLASYKRPASVIFTHTISKNPMGKVLKNDLRRRFGGEIPKSKSPAN